MSHRWLFTITQAQPLYSECRQSVKFGKLGIEIQ